LTSKHEAEGHEARHDVVIVRIGNFQLGGPNANRRNISTFRRTEGEEEQARRMWPTHLAPTF